MCDHRLDVPRQTVRLRFRGGRHAPVRGRQRRILGKWKGWEAGKEVGGSWSSDREDISQ